MVTTDGPEDDGMAHVVTPRCSSWVGEPRVWCEDSELCGEPVEPADRDVWRGAGVPLSSSLGRSRARRCLVVAYLRRVEDNVCHARESLQMQQEGRTNSCWSNVLLFCAREQAHVYASA